MLLFGAEVSSVTFHLLPAVDRIPRWNQKQTGPP